MRSDTITRTFLAIVLLAGGACSRSSSPVLTGPNPNPTMRLTAARFATAAGVELAVLGDRDTTTSITADGSMEVAIAFDHEVEIRAVKVHGTGVALDLPGEGGVAADGGWGKLTLAEPRRATALRVRVRAERAPALLDEIEVWGAGRARAPRDPQELAEATRSNPAAYEDVTVLSATPAAATLDPGAPTEGGRCLRGKLPGNPVRGARRAYLAYEADVPVPYALERIVDGGAVSGGFWVGNVASSRTLVDELDPEALGAQSEVILCAPARATGKVQLSGLRLLVLQDDGLDLFDRETHLRFTSAVDGKLVPAAVSGTAQLSFDRPMALDAAAIRLGVAPLTLRSVDLLEGSGWVTQSNVALATQVADLPLGGRSGSAMRLAFPAPVRTDLPAASVLEVEAAGSGLGRRVGVGRIVLTAPALRWVNGHESGERFGDRAWVAGWAESAAGPGRVEIGGAEVGVAGVFGVALTRPATGATPWTVEIRARFPDGAEVVRTVLLDRDRAAELLKESAGASAALTDGSRYGLENQTAWGKIDPKDGGKLSLGTDVTFEAPGGAVGKVTQVGVTRKGPEEIPPLDAGMVNVTAPANGAYRFLPKGQKFAKPVRVGLPFDPSLLPEGIAPEEIQTWFYDEEAEQWTALPRVELQRANSRLVSETTHFTFMINAVLVLPEHPGPSSFNPNSVKDLKAADPSAGIDLIAPPGVNNMGSAQVGLPIRLPAARGGYQPELRIAYDSGGANGWLGVGWDLPTSSVQIDTRFGAPEYALEQRYLLDGEQLVPTDEAPTCAGGGIGKRYRARVEKSFRRILRCGTGPTDFWFEVQDKQGNFFLYGRDPRARLADYAMPSYVGGWYLERVVDTNGNLTQFAYDVDHKALTTVPQPFEKAANHEEDFRQLYLRSIQYSGRAWNGVRDPFGTAETGHYHVELVSEQDSRGRHLDRPDAITSGRPGFKTVLRRRLKSILIQLERDGTSDTIREYRISYERKAASFWKSRVTKVEVFGAGAPGVRKLFNTHAFTYWEPDYANAFSAPVEWTFAESPDDLSITHGEESGWATHFYGGLGFTYDKITGSVGARVGKTQHTTVTKSTLIDVNGDGLPDRIVEGGGGYDVRFNSGVLGGVAQKLRRALPEGDPAAGQLLPVPLPTLGKEKGKGLNTSVQGSFGPVSADTGYSYFETKTTEFLGDADGDGLVDVVRESGVLLNQQRSAAQKGFAFAPMVSGTSLAATPDANNDDAKELKKKLDEQLRPSDVLVEWTAPFWGRVDLHGELAFVPHTQPSPLPPERDGVRIQGFRWSGFRGQAAEKIFEQVKTVAEVSVPTPVGMANVDVYPGMRLFIVLSTLDDFPLDRTVPSPLEDVTFSPVISYTHLGRCDTGYCAPLTDEQLGQVEPNGASTFRFDQAADLRMAGQPMPSVSVPATGTLRLDTTLVKRRSTTHVRVCVQRFAAEMQVKDLRCEERPTGLDTLIDQDLSADEEGTFPLAGTYSVRAGEKLVFRVQTDLPVDPAVADWAVGGRMETACGVSAGGCEAPPPELAAALSFRGEPWFPVHNPVVPWGWEYYYLPSDASAPPDDRPLQAWVAPTSGTIRVHANPWLQVRPRPVPQFGVGLAKSPNIFLAARTADRLIVEGRVSQLYALGAPAAAGEVRVAAGERVFFEIFSDADFYGAWWRPDVTFTSDVTGLAAPVLDPPLNQRYTSIRWGDNRLAFGSRFGGGHHLWHYGAWHGGKAVDVDPRKLYLKIDAGSSQESLEKAGNDPAVKEATTIASTLVPRRLGTRTSATEPGLAPDVPAFVSKDGATYVTAGRWHASREGELEPGGGGPGTTTSLRATFALGPALRQSSGYSNSLGASISVGGVGLSLSFARGESFQKTDVLDMNGDRVVDVVSAAGDRTNVRVTDIHDPSQLHDRGLQGASLRKSKDGTASFGLGVSAPWRRMTDDGTVKALISMYPSVGGGVGVNFGATEKELVDVNGDGLPDEVSRDGDRFRVRLNLGTRFAAASDYLPVGNWSGGALDDLVGKVAGTLGDAYTSADSVRRTTSISVNANAGFTLYENYGGTVNWDSSLAATQVMLADINGDGLPDYVRKSNKTGYFTVRLNNGAGFDAEQTLPVQPWPAGVTRPWLRDSGLAGGVSSLLRLVNGDTAGLDTVEANGTYGEMPTLGFVISWGVGPLSPALTPWLHFSVGADKTFKRVSGFALGLQDMDGDGLADHVLKAEKQPGSSNEAVWVRLNQLKKVNLLKSVSRPLGGSFELDYTRTGNTVSMPESRWVLKDVVVHDGRADGNPGHDLATTYGYGEGRHHRQERDFLGFDRTTETRADGTTLTRTYRNDSALVKGLLLTETLEDAGHRLLSRTTNSYSAVSPPISAPAQACVDRTPFFLMPEALDWCGSFFVSLDGVEQELHETGGDPAARLVTRQSYTYDRTTGNVETFTDLGDADPANTGDDLFATVTYANDAAAKQLYAVARPETLLVKGHATDADADFVRKRVGHYDGRGNLTDLQSFLSDGQAVQVDLTWNADGKLEKIQQPQVRTGRYWVQYRYDTSGVTRSFPTRVDDAHGYVSTARYDERFGEVETTTDVNGNVTRRVLDANGRISQVFGPYETTVPAVRVDYAPDATPPRAHTRNLLPNGGGWLSTFVYFDGMGRTIQTQKTSLADGRPLGVTASGRQRFDVMGRVVEQGIAYYLESIDPGFDATTPVYRTLTDWDVLGRKVRTVEPNGGVYRMTYDLGRAANDPFLRRRATVVDPLQKTRVMYRRLDDRISAVEEHIDSLVHTTRYQYDRIGDLRKVIDAKGNETKVEYDRLGRRTQLASLDAGTTDFTYDAMGNLAKRQDGNLRQAVKDGKLTADQAYVTYEYDLDQLIEVHKPFGTDVKYEYGPPGSGENGIGRVVRVVDDAGFETRGYGRLGEVVRSTRTVKPLKPNDSPQTFETRFRFDSFGRMLTLWYPDGERLDYLYDLAGLVTRAVGTRPATKHFEAGTEVYLASMTYDEFGQRRHAVLGNGATTEWRYQPDTQRLEHIDTSSQGRTLQALTYSYDLVGNVLTLTNSLGEATGRRSGAVSYTYEYDDLYRLTKATGTALSRPGVVDRFKTTYAFDEIHNMKRLDQKHWLTTANDATNETAHPPHTNHDFDYAYGGAGPHQATKIGDRNLVYDANGNTERECRDHGDPTCSVNADKLRRYFWGEENELTAVIDGGGWNVTRFIYDAGGQRVVKLGRGGESITVGQFFALKGRKAATKHVFIGETRLASKLLPSPGWEPSWSTGTAPAGPITTVDTTSGCDPSTYQPQKCPIAPAANPVLDRRPDTTKIKPETYYYHSDHLGSTSWVTDQNGRVHEHVDYFPYGEVWRSPRYDSDGDPTHRQQFLFSAKEMDEETGLYYFGARYLDPVRARWVSTDPAFLRLVVPGADQVSSRLQDWPAGLSVYAYVAWRPMAFMDPDGQAKRGDVVIFTWSGKDRPGHAAIATRVDKDGNPTHAAGFWGASSGQNKGEFKEIELGERAKFIAGTGDLGAMEGKPPLTSKTTEEVIKAWEGRETADNWGPEGNVCVDVITATDGLGGEALRGAMVESFKKDEERKSGDKVYKDYGAKDIGRPKAGNPSDLRRVPRLYEFLKQEGRLTPGPAAPKGAR